MTRILPALIVPALTVPLLLAGCGRSDPTHIWTLDPLPPPRAAATAPVTLPVRVAAVHVPLALDRLELVEEDAANRVTVRDFDRWAAPLGDLLRATLTADLRARLPGGAVLAAAEPRPPHVRELIVDVAALRPTAEGYLLDASWSLVGSPGQLPVRHEARLLQPAPAPGAAGQAQATTALVGQLADAIAAALPPG